MSINCWHLLGSSKTTNIWRIAYLLKELMYFLAIYPYWRVCYFVCVLFCIQRIDSSWHCVHQKFVLQTYRRFLLYQLYLSCFSFNMFWFACFSSVIVIERAKAAYLFYIKQFGGSWKSCVNSDWFFFSFFIQLFNFNIPQ